MKKMPRKSKPKSVSETDVDVEPLTISAYLASLTIENVRCFGPQPQSLHLLNSTGALSQWTVILGNNGTGKTTLLQCLTAFDPMPSPRESALFDPRGLIFDLDPLRPRFQRMGERTDWSLGVQMVVTDKLDAATKAQPFPPASIRFDEGKRQLNFSAPEEVGPRLPFSICYGYGANRRMGRLSLADAPKNDGTATLFDENVELRNASDWLLQIDYAASKKSPLQLQFQHHRDQVIEILKRVLPDVVDVRIAAPTRLNRRPDIEFKTPDGWVSLAAIGYGYRTFVAWVVDLASRMVQRYSRHQDPLAQPAVVLVDEIDLHLHPTWQRKLMTYLSERFPNTQFIVTAHSPIFVHAAANANIILLRRDQKLGHVVIENAPEIIRNWRIDQLLTSDLFGLQSTRPPGIEKLLAERRKILAKTTLTKRDRTRLQQLETEIGPLPTADTVGDIKRASRLDRALDLLEKQLEVKT